ncbi:MAG: hypothetical protein P1V51_17270 [Deltaproteobacteria bacterium]|nr:hypothetical protein [Deltaproteobacteria bacterium]
MSEGPEGGGSRFLPHEDLLGPTRRAVAEGDTGLAAAAYLRIARGNRGKVAAQALAELARLHLEAGRAEEAGKRVAEALSHDGKNPLALALHAATLASQEREKDFYRIAERCLPGVEVQEREQLMDLAADLLLERRAYGRFATLARAAVAGLSPEEVSPLLAGAVAVAAQRSPSLPAVEAFALLEPVLGRAMPLALHATLQSLGAHLLCQMADEQIAAGDGARAYHLFGRAIELDPELGSARVGQGRLLLSLGHHEEAVEVVKPAPSMVGGGEAAWAVLGRAFLELGKHHHARVCAERAGPWARRDRDLWRLLHE